MLSEFQNSFQNKIKAINKMWFLMLLSYPVYADDISYTMYSNKLSLLELARLRKDEDEIRVYFFIRDKPQGQELQLNNTEQLLKSGLNLNKTTKMIVHGWIANENTTAALATLKNSYITATDFNIIVVDWSTLACTDYKYSSSFVDTVSLFLIDFLEFLVKNGLSVKKLHLIGHCLGAHIVSYVRKHFRTQKLLIDAITALDPAYPLFKFKSEEELIHPTDARYVEVVHTNSETWGFRVPLGHVDFYPNGGKNQPGCENHARGLFAHICAILYYADAITSSVPFTAIYCESYEAVYCYISRTLLMSGIHLNYGVTGMYYFVTQSKAPFSRSDPNTWNILNDNRIMVS